MDRKHHLPPDLAEIERLAEQALAAIPAELRAHVENVVLRIEDF